MKTKMFFFALLAVLVCSCGPTSKEIEVKEKSIVLEDESDGLYEAYTRGAALFSLVPETTVLSWDKDSEQKAGFKQLNVTVKIRLDQQPDTTLYALPDTDSAVKLRLYLADNNGVLFSGSQFDATQIPLPFFPGLSLTDVSTEEAKIKDLLASEPGTVAEVTFVTIVQESYIDNMADHVAACVLVPQFPLFDKNPRRR